MAGMDKDDDLSTGTDVRLLVPLEGVPQGAIGRIIGFFRGPGTESCVVAFDGSIGAVARVPAEALEPVEATT